MVSLSLCATQGIRGSIRAFGKEIWIYPSKYVLADTTNGTVYNLTDEHIIYSENNQEDDEEKESSVIIIDI